MKKESKKVLIHNAKNTLELRKQSAGSVVNAIDYDNNSIILKESNKLTLSDVLAAKKKK